MAIGGYLRGLGRAIVGRQPATIEKLERIVERVVDERPRKIKESTDAGFRRLTGGGDWRRDLPSGKYDRHLRVCQELWRENPVAKKGIANIASFVVSEGFELKATCADDQKRAVVQSALDDHYELNEWHKLIGQRVTTLAVEGEWNYLVSAPNPATGHVRLCKIHPEAISDILPIPYDAEQMGQAKVGEEFCRAIGAPGDTLPIVRRDFNSGRLTGKVLHTGINRLSGQTRGWSDLLVVADYLDALDRISINEVDRVHIQKSFAWICELLNADEAQVIKRRQELIAAGPPEPGSILVTTSNEKWSTASPTLNLMESIKFCEFLLMIIFGGLNMPQHWFSQGGDVNKATAGEMGTPVWAFIRERKEQIMDFIHRGAEIAMDTMLDMGIFAPAGITKADLSFVVVSRDPDRTSYETIGESLEKVATSLHRGAAMGWIRDQDAGAAYRQAATQLGMGGFESPEVEEAMAARKSAEMGTAAMAKKSGGEGDGG